MFTGWHKIVAFICISNEQTASCSHMESTDLKHRHKSKCRAYSLFFYLWVVKIYSLTDQITRCQTADLPLRRQIQQCAPAQTGQNVEISLKVTIWMLRRTSHIPGDGVLFHHSIIFEENSTILKFFEMPKFEEICPNLDNSKQKRPGEIPSAQYDSSLVQIRKEFISNSRMSRLQCYKI